MTQSIAILGRQPALGIAELESLYGSDKLQPLAYPGAVLLDTPPDQVDFGRLGGTIKLAKLLTRLDTTNWRAITKYLVDTIPQHLQYIPEGKIRFGLGVYGLRVDPRDINRTGLEVKKVIKNAGRSVRAVPNTTPDLGSAQTLHNQLTGPTGMELALIADGNSTLLAQVVNVQDIAAYAKRDQGRPKRDARVGMLPPKLAQIIINIAHPSEGATVLDPFCGTGVVLQEAMLMGYQAYGTDLESRMIEYSQGNLEWLTEAYHPSSTAYRLNPGDATAYDWEQPFDTIACETYLGRPFNTAPNPTDLRQVMSDVNTIHKKFLQNVARQTQPGFRMCIAVPAWHIPVAAGGLRASTLQGDREKRTEPYIKYGEGASQRSTQQSAASLSRVGGSADKSAKTAQIIQHLPVLDHLEELGYTRMSFVHTSYDQLVYHRKDQIVGRELVVLSRM